MDTARVEQPAPAANADNGEVDRLAGVPAVTVAQASVRYPEADENVHSFARKPDRDAFLRATGSQGGSAENMSRRSPEVCGLGDAGQREQERVDFVNRHAHTQTTKHTGPNSIAQHHVTVEIVDGEAANSGNDACVQEGANPSAPVSTRPLAHACTRARTCACANLAPSRRNHLIMCGECVAGIRSASPHTAPPDPESTA